MPYEISCPHIADMEHIGMRVNHIKGLWHHVVLCLYRMCILYDIGSFDNNRRFLGLAPVLIALFS